MYIGKNNYQGHASLRASYMHAFLESFSHFHQEAIHSHVDGKCQLEPGFGVAIHQDH